MSEVEAMLKECFDNSRTETTLLLLLLLLSDE